jgi:hypothetical protein
MTRPIGTAPVGGNGGGGGGDAGIAYITSAADLEAMFPAVGGVHTIDVGSLWQIPSGQTEIDISPNVMSFVFPGGVEFIGGQGQITTTADAPLVSGEPSLKNVALANTNIAGASARCVDVSSLAGRTLTWAGVALIGDRPGRITNAFGVTLIDVMQIIPLTPAGQSLEIDGSIGAVLANAVSVVPPGGGAYTGIHILPTASIGSMSMTNWAIIAAFAGDALILVDAAATLLPPGGLAALNGTAQSGAVLFDPAGIDETDPKISALLNNNVPSSKWLGDVTFDSSGVTEIQLSHSGSPEVIPTENTAGDAVASMPPGKRFDFNIDAVQDFQVISTSRTGDISGPVSWDMSIERIGGSARQFTAWIEFRPDNLSPWALVPGTRAEANLQTVFNQLSKSAQFTWGTTTEFRLMVDEPTGGTTGIANWNLRIGPGGP